MVISLCCGKGGTGKTTSTCNIGAALAEHGKRVLLIDNDQQGSLTLSLGYEPSALPSTLANLMFQAIDMPELLNETIERTIQQASDNLHLIPANKKLAGILSRLVSMQNTRSMFPNDNDGIAPEKVLSTIVERLKTRYDYILIDCPPSLGLLTLNALTAADYLIIPVQAQFLAMRGMAKITNVIEIVRERLNPNLNIGGIVITQFDKRKTLNKSVVELISDSFCDKVFKTIIRDNVALAEAPINGKNIFEYNKNSNGAKDYMSLAQEVLKLK